MQKTILQAINTNFLGNSPNWYKLTIIGFLALNPFLLYFAGPFVTGWVLIVEFIFTLAMSLKCYPLPPGGLLAFQGVVLGMTTPGSVYLPVLLLLIFMVAGIYFMKELLQYIFTKLLLDVRSKLVLSFLFLCTGAFLSAFLDALTVIAVVISVAYGLYDLYHHAVSEKGGPGDHDLVDAAEIKEPLQRDLGDFRGFLRNLMMHAAVGTALGGVTTLVKEPQNLLIAHTAGWTFSEFFSRVAPISFPVVLVGAFTCVLAEYQTPIPRCFRAETRRRD